MSNFKEEDYKLIFIESLGIEDKDFNTEIKYNLRPSRRLHLNADAK